MSLLISVCVFFCTLHFTNAGCKYTNPQWMTKDENLKSAPEVFFTTSDGAPDTDHVWLMANWNLSLVEKYSQCVDTVEVMVKKIKDPKTKKSIICSHERSAIQKCSGSLLKKDFCDETLDVWVRVINKDYKDGIQPIGAPSMTRIESLECDKTGSQDSLGEPLPSQSCESLQPAWNGSPEFVVPEGTKGKRFVNVTWTNHLITSVACVDEIEIKYWEEGVPSTYHKENIRTTDAGDVDHIYHVELEVNVCKTYSYILKAMKNDPYFVATNEGKFTSKCDDYLLSSLTSQTTKTPRPTTKTTSTTTSEEVISEAAETTMALETEADTTGEVSEPTEASNDASGSDSSGDDVEVKAAAETEASEHEVDEETTLDEATSTTHSGTGSDLETTKTDTMETTVDEKESEDFEGLDQSTSRMDESTDVRHVNTSIILEEEEQENVKSQDVDHLTHAETDSTTFGGTELTPASNIGSGMTEETEESVEASHARNSSTHEMEATEATEMNNTDEESNVNHTSQLESIRTSQERMDLSRLSPNLNLIAQTKYGRSLMGQSDTSEKDNARALELNPWGRSNTWTIHSNSGVRLVITVISIMMKFRF